MVDISNRLSMRQLRAFEAVVAEGSFTMAARRLHLTQSALSVLIRELERELGVQLFDRTTRRVELAEAGKSFHPHVRRVLNELNDGVASVAELRDKKKGVLRIAAPQLMACTLIPGAIARYRDLYPDIEIRLQDTLPEHLLASVQSGDVELAIGPEAGSDDRGLARLSLIRSRHWLVCRSGDTCLPRDRVHWEDLERYTFIAPTRDFARRMKAALGDSVAPLLEPAVHEVSYVTTALGLVAAGMGVTLCPSYAAPLVRAYGLKMLPMAEPAFHREVCVYSQSLKHFSPAAEAFVGLFRDYLKAGGGDAPPFD